MAGGETQSDLTPTLSFSVTPNSDSQHNDPFLIQSQKTSRPIYECLNIP